MKCKENISKAAEYQLSGLYRKINKNDKKYQIEHLLRNLHTMKCKENTFLSQMHINYKQVAIMVNIKILISSKDQVRLILVNFSAIWFEII